MRLYLAGSEATLIYDIIYDYFKNNDIYLLFSYYYKKGSKNFLRLLENINKDNILIDSGAFTFIQGGLNVDIEQYTDGYIDFINKYDIKYFFEMDVDSVLGYDKVKILRKKIEDGTGKKVIPVWHVNRGIEEFKKHCAEYDYVAIGSGDTKDTKIIVKKMIQYANSKKVKTHLLGYSKPDMIDLNAYSYDSSSWNIGAWGGLYNWSKKDKRPVRQNKIENKRIKVELTDAVALHNLNVWKHYQDYLDYQGKWRLQ